MANKKNETEIINSMEKIGFEEILQKTESRYGLVLSAAARANELVSGEQPLIKTDTQKIPKIAFQEIMRGKITFKLGKEKESKPKSD